LTGLLSNITGPGVGLTGLALIIHRGWWLALCGVQAAS
jgi:hypothetical protein